MSRDERNLTIITSIVAILICIYITLNTITNYNMVIDSGYTPIPKEYLRDAMAFHGTDHCIKEEEWKFLRDETLTTLFTPSCVKSITGGRCGNFKELEEELQ